MFFRAGQLNALTLTIILSRVNSKRNQKSLMDYFGTLAPKTHAHTIGHRWGGMLITGLKWASSHIPAMRIFGVGSGCCRCKCRCEKETAIIPLFSIFCPEFIMPEATAGVGGFAFVLVVQATVTSPTTTSVTVITPSRGFDNDLIINQLLESKFEQAHAEKHAEENSKVFIY